MVLEPFRLVRNTIHLRQASLCRNRQGQAERHEIRFRRKHLQSLARYNLDIAMRSMGRTAATLAGNAGCQPLSWRSAIHTVPRAAAVSSQSAYGRADTGLCAHERP